MKTNKTVKFIFSCVLALSLVLSSFVFAPLSATAATPEIWDGTIATGFAGGTGSAVEPYLITNGAELRYLTNLCYSNSDATYGKYYKITNDIVLNDTSIDNWTASAHDFGISRPYNMWGFRGHLDGDNHIIKGLYMNHPDNDYIGLFPTAGQGATINNLGIVDSYIAGKNAGAFIGAAIGRSGDTMQTQTTLTNCFVDTTVTINGSASNGGLVGYNDANLRFTYCYATANLGTAQAGGLAGRSIWSGGAGTGNLYATQCYTTAAKYMSWNDAVLWKSGAIVNYCGVTEAAKGEGAKTAMSDLDFETIYTTKAGDYPILKVFADQSEDIIWNGTIATGFAGGDGSANNPYQIANGSQLRYLTNLCYSNSDATYGKYYIITNDIVLNDTSVANWTASAHDFGISRPYNLWGFRGHLDGANHIIKGLYMNHPDNDYIGLFPTAGQGATISNLGIIDSYIAGKNAGAFIGGAIGRSGDTLQTQTKLTNCFVDSTVTISGSASNGGLVGYNDAHLRFTNCYATANLGTAQAGGLAGRSIWSGGAGTGNLYATQCYTTAANYMSWSDISLWKSGAIVNYCGVTESAKGIDAKTAMPNLDWTIYKVKADDYPVLRAFDTDNSSALWNGNIAASLSTGSGTITDPYKISTASELAYVAKNLGTTAGKYYELTKDIVINDTSEADWTDTAAEWPSKITLGNAWDSYKGELGFAGVLNGNGHTISGIYINGGTGAGLFSIINGGAVIYNLNIDNSSITSNMAGAFGGYAKTHTYAWNGSAFASTGDLGNIRIANCTVRDGVTINGTNGAGGFIGCVTNTFDADSDNNNIIFGNCGSMATVTATASGRANGFIGENYQGGFYVNNSFCFGNAARAGLDPVSVNLMINQNANTLKDANALQALWQLDFVNTWKATAGGYPVLTTAQKHNGDITLDGLVNALDLSNLRVHLLEVRSIVNTDVNNDDETNILDLVRLKKRMIGVDSVSSSSVTLNGKTYSYVWGSEFDSNSLDTSKFSYTSDMNAYGNLSLAQNDLAYADVQDGNLVLSIKKDGDVYKTAGCIGTPSKMHYKYGYAEIRAKVPFGTATFPAFWAKSVNLGKGYLNEDEYGVEIDIFEQHISTNTVASNIHKWVKDGETMTSDDLDISKPTANITDTAAYHTYGFEWYEGIMKFYVDGECIGSYDYSTGSNPDIKDFDSEIYLILDNMMETAYAGDNFSSTFAIDYIRLYQNANDGGSLTVF